MNVLVTGATGFIGRHLVGRLTREGDHIRALVLSEEDASPLDALGVEVVRGDLCDYRAMERAVTNRQVVFHLAAKIGEPNPSGEALQAINVDGTANVARAAVQASVDRFVLCSSVSVYGRVINNLAITEHTATQPDLPYGKSKLLAERIVLSHHERDGLPVVVTRLAGVFGPGARSWLSLFRSIASGRFRLIGSGDNYHHYVDVADVVAGLVLCGTVKGVEGRTYILAGSEPVRLRELIQMIGEEVGETHFRASLPAGPFYLYKMLNQLAYTWSGHRLPRANRLDLFLSEKAFDISRGRKELGYVPKVTTREAVRRTAEWFKTRGYL